jgi:hypothetical protein
VYLKLKNATGESNTLSDTIGLITSITLDLVPGWNSISCPGDPVISDWSTIKAGNPNIAVIVIYDTTQKKFEMATNIEFGKSYFIGVYNNTQIELEYNPRNSLALPTKAGWNPLGSVSGSIPVSNITSEPSGKIAVTVYYSPNTKKFEMASTIEPGVGYMVGCYNDCILNMSYSLPAPPNNQKIVTEPLWESILSVQTQSDHKELVFGMNRSASDDIDLYDRPVPPFPEIGEVKAGWVIEGSSFDLLETSFVKDNSESSWELSLELSENGEVSWRNLPKTHRFILLYDNRAVNMQTERSLSLPVGKHTLLISVKSSVGIPAKTSLLASYPNPCNPETWIPYELSIDTKVKIMVYSSNGNLVRSLDLGYKPAGRYVDRSKAVYWDGKNESGESVSSGIYFYTLVTPEFSQVKKLLIIR